MKANNSVASTLADIVSKPSMLELHDGREELAVASKSKIPAGFQEILVLQSDPPEIFVIDQRYIFKEILGKASYCHVWWLIKLVLLIDYLFLLNCYSC